MKVRMAIDPFSTMREADWGSRDEALVRAGIELGRGGNRFMVLSDGTEVMCKFEHGAEQELKIGLYYKEDA